MDKEDYNRHRRAGYGGFLRVGIIAAARPDKETGLFYEKYNTEKQIDKIDEALKKNWFPTSEDQDALVEAKKSLSKKLQETEIKYEEAKKETASKIVERTFKKSFPSKTAP